jgi:localization factor PodJL
VKDAPANARSAPRLESAPRPSTRSIALAESAALRQQIDQLSRNVASLPKRQSAMPLRAPRAEDPERENARSERTTSASHDQEAIADDRALRRLAARTDEIRDLIANVIAKPAQSGRVERQLDVLGARIDALAASAPTMSETNELARGLNEIRNLLNNGMNTATLDALDRKIDQLSRRMETISGESRDSHQFDDIARRLDNVHRRIEANASLAMKPDTSALELAIQELSRKLEKPAPKLEIPAPDFTPVESEIRRLSNKIDAATARTDNPLLEGVRRDIATLAARVDAVSATVQSATSTASQANIESMEALRRDVNGLASRMDRIAASTPEASMLGGLQSQIEILVDRIEALPRRDASGMHALEAQIVKLADKIDSIAAPSREETMLAQLQTEIGRLARQFNAAPAGEASSALAMLEQVQTYLDKLPAKQRMTEAAQTPIDGQISDMFKQIQALRDAAMDATEATERQAEREAIDVKADALAQSPGASEALKSELLDLRAQQEAADKRTNETLSAVHQTLERLVDRLSDLESDLGEVRPEPVAAQQPKQEKQSVPAPRQEKSESAPQETRKEPSVEPLMAPIGAAPAVDVKTEPPQPRMREPGPGAVLSNPASFIAAARRASIAASEQAQHAEAKPNPISRIGDLLTQFAARATEVRAEQADKPEAEQKEMPGQGKPGAMRSAISARKRPILIALAGLVVILGSLQGLKFLREEATSLPAATQAATPAPEPTQLAQAQPKQDTTEAEAASPALPEAALAAPAKVPAPGFTPPLAASGFDTAPTASTPTSATKQSLSATPVAPVAPQPAQKLSEAAASGQANAQYEMGVRLAEGRGMTQDNQAALQWLEKAARQNLAPAQYRLAAMLERGVGGPKDLKRAIDLYGKAATQGHVRAMHNMGVLSAEGVEGKPDYATAATWFRKAADFGLRDSQYNLAILYARGMGVDKNLPVSWAWFTAAAAMGDADSAQKREEIAARLNPNQMAAAKAMVEAFKARTPDPAVNDVSTPPGGWDTATVTQLPKPAAPTPKAKVSKL